MVSPTYLLQHKPPPAGLKRWFDQQAIPAAADTAAMLETALEALALHVRARPARSLAMITIGTFIVSQQLSRTAWATRANR